MCGNSLNKHNQNSQVLFIMEPTPPYGLNLLKTGLVDYLDVDESDKTTPPNANVVSKDEAADPAEAGKSAEDTPPNTPSEFIDWISYLPHLLLFIPLLISYLYQSTLINTVVMLSTFYIIINKFENNTKFETLHTVWTSILTFVTILLVSSEPKYSIKVFIVHLLMVISFVLYIAEDYYSVIEDVWKFTSIASLCVALTIQLNAGKLLV